jgi:hypothetical protein
MSFLILLACLCQGEATPEAAGALRTGYAQWQSDLDFRAECEWKSALFPSPNAADSFGWDWLTLSSDKMQRSNGYIAKRGTHFRIVLNPDRPPQPVVGAADAALAQGVSTLTHVGYDEMTNGRFDVSRPAPVSRIQLIDRILFERTVNDYRTAPRFATASSLPELTPLRPLKTLSSDPMEMRGHNEAQLPEVHVSTNINERGNHVVSLTAKRNDQVTRRSLEFLSEGEHLLVAMRETYAIIKNAQEQQVAGEIHVQLDNFVRLPAGSVPGRIRHTVTSLNGVTLCSEYLSSQTTISSDTDFAFPLPIGVPIWGLQQSERFAAQGQVSLDELADGDVPVVPVVAQAVSQVQQPEVNVKAEWSSTILALNVVAIVLIGAIILPRRKNRSV